MLYPLSYEGSPAALPGQSLPCRLCGTGWRVVRRESRPVWWNSNGF